MIKITDEMLDAGLRAPVPAPMLDSYCAWERLVLRAQIEATLRAGKKAPWVVDIKGAPGAKGFEISVLRDDNEHGKRSYGWFDDDKLLITHNGGPCDWPLTPMIWHRMVRQAYEIAAELNAAEGLL